MLFFQCTAALSNPANRRREGIRWWIVSYTVLMFSFATILTGAGLNLESISYIDRREFTSAGSGSPGPLGYQSTIASTAFGLIPLLCSS